MRDIWDEFAEGLRFFAYIIGMILALAAVIGAWRLLEMVAS